MRESKRRLLDGCKAADQARCSEGGSSCIAACGRCVLREIDDREESSECRSKCQRVSRVREGMRACDHATGSPHPPVCAACVCLPLNHWQRNSCQSFRCFRCGQEAPPSTATSSRAENNMTDKARLRSAFLPLKRDSHRLLRLKQADA